MTPSETCFTKTGFNGRTTTYVYTNRDRVKLAEEHGGPASTESGQSYLFQDHLGSTRLRVSTAGDRQGW